MLAGFETNCTVGCRAALPFLGPGLIVAVIVFVSAVVLAIVPVATPLAFVTEGCTSVLFDPVLASCNVWRATGWPFWSRTVTGIVDVVEPLASTPSVGAAVAVDSVPLMVLGSPTNCTVGCWARTT